ncbi:hypothetical protein N7499_008136 [Penicillium canescens]|nr:hypothetical protein N7499_008136 [Penicillium canescens]KAJ6158467.1 hypothetical protein N7485_011293 [Penicillium canescens]
MVFGVPSTDTAGTYSNFGSRGASPESTFERMPVGMFRFDSVGGDGTSREPSVAELFGKNILTEEILSSLTDTGRLIVLVTLYVEECRALELCTSWVYTQGIHAVEYPKNVSHQDHMGSRWGYAAQRETPLDQVFSHFRTEIPSRSQPLESMTRKKYHLLSILRHVPLRLLYVFSGWMTTHQERSAARKQLEGWVNQSREARKALVHAAVLFQSIRNQKTPTPFDPWCLLIASLYIWTYSTLAGHRVRSAMPAASFSRRIVRLDQPLDPTTARTWLEEAPTMTAHITGIGMLTEPDSATPGIFVTSTLLVLNYE